MRCWICKKHPAKWFSHQVHYGWKAACGNHWKNEDYYIPLEDIFRDYLNSNLLTSYQLSDVNDFVNKITPYWTKIVDQFIPATTLWTGGNLIENSIYGRSKFVYRRACQTSQITEDLYPDFETAIEEDLETLLGEEVNFRGLISLTGVTYFPSIEVDGVVYGGPDFDYSGITGASVTLSG